MGVIILNGARIGAGSIIAAGTLIPEGTVVEPRSLWMGVPGKLRKQLNDEDQETDPALRQELPRLQRKLSERMSCKQ